jgi:Outer membrane protein beta-barrel domain
MKKLFFILFIHLFINDLSAQNRFGGGVVLGFNGSQMDGDRAAGYNKVGLNAGLRGTVRLNEEGRWLLTTEILFSQRGARSVEKDYFITNWKATLNYLEVPVMVSYLDWYQEEAQYYRVHFTVGLSYGRLFSTKISEIFTHPREAVDVFQQNDIGYTAGLSYFVNRHWGFTCRYTRSFNFLFHPNKHPNDPILNGLTALQGYFLTFQTCWNF